MRNRTKLRKKDNTNNSFSSKIMSIEQTICDSHTMDIFYDDTLAVTRIKSDPNLFFRYAKKFSLCTKASGPLLHPHTHLLTDDKTEMCMILLDQSTACDPVSGDKSIPGNYRHLSNFMYKYSF